MLSIKRLELKYLLQKSEYVPMFKYIHENFEEVYTKRYITSIYYDNSNFDSFSDSEEGVTPRKKIRIRNYNNYPNFILEIKHHKFDGRSKFTRKIKKVENYIIDSEYGVCRPNSKISYFRRYFVFKTNKLIRLTLDNSLNYQKINFLDQTEPNLNNEDLNILEVKCPESIKVEFIDNLIPIRRVRFSKYCDAISKIYRL